jgi:phage tail-like protein
MGEVRSDLLLGFKFVVDILIPEPVSVGFSSISDLSIEYEHKVYSPGSATESISIPISRRNNDITMEKGMTTMPTWGKLLKWFESIHTALSNGQPIRKASATIRFVPGLGDWNLPNLPKEPGRIGRWNMKLTGVCPKKFEVSGLDASQSRVLIGSLTLSVDHMEFDFVEDRFFAPESREF